MHSAPSIVQMEIKVLIMEIVVKIPMKGGGRMGEEQGEGGNM